MAQYYEARRPVDVIGFLKTPYGLMIGFSVFAMVVMPMMKVGGSLCLSTLSLGLPATKSSRLQPDAAETLSRAAARVRPGGVCAVATLLNPLNTHTQVDPEEYREAMAELRGSGGGTGGSGGGQQQPAPIGMQRRQQIRDR